METCERNNAPQLTGSGDPFPADTHDVTPAPHSPNKGRQPPVDVGKARVENEDVALVSFRLSTTCGERGDWASFGLRRMTCMRHVLEMHAEARRPIPDDTSIYPAGPVWYFLTIVGVLTMATSILDSLVVRQHQVMGA